MTDRDKDGNSNTVTTNFRGCIEDDFRGNNYVDEIHPAIENLMCPDMSLFSDNFFVKNAYSDSERAHIST